MLVLFAVYYLPICAFAHPGRTDSDGGHYNHSTGEYHYHHGYPEHDHYDMDGDGIIDCPYDFVDKTGKNSGSSSSDSGYSYSYSATEETIQRVPETSESKPAPTEPKKEVMTGNMSAIYTAIVMFLVGAIVVAVQSSSYRDEKNRLEELNREKSAENKKLNCELDRLKSIHEIDETIISSLQEEVTRLAEVDHKCEIYKEQYDTLLEILQRKNRETKLDGKSIDNPVSEEELDKLSFKIEIPAHVFFDNDGLPVLLKRGSSGQYGEYTVYTSFNSNIYHADSLCSGYNAQPTHLFRAINQGKRVCKKCANQLGVPDTIPEWYLDLRAFRSEIDE